MVQLEVLTDLCHLVYWLVLSLLLYVHCAYPSEDDKQKEFTELGAVLIEVMGKIIRALIYLLLATSSFVINDFYFISRKKQICANNHTTNLYSNERNFSYGILKQRLSGYSCFLYLLSSAFIWSQIVYPACRTPRTNMVVGLPGLVKMNAGLVFLLGVSLIAAHSCNSILTDSYPNYVLLSIVSFWSAYYMMKMLIYSRINPYIESPTGPCSEFAYRGFIVWWISICMFMKALLLTTGLSFKVAMSTPLLLSLGIARRTASGCKDKGLVLIHGYTPIMILLSSGATIEFFQSVGERLHDKTGVTNAASNVIGSLALAQCMSFALKERVDISSMLPLVRR